MAAQTQTMPAARPAPQRRKKSVGSRIAGFFSKGVVNFVLLIIAVFWLIPTIGLMLMSLRTVGDNAASGWWTVLTKPADLTIENYVKLLSKHNITGSMWNTIMIAIPGTV